jgi:hypothetical protein
MNMAKEYRRSKTAIASMLRDMLRHGEVVTGVTTACAFSRSGHQNEPARIGGGGKRIRLSREFSATVNRIALSDVLERLGCEPGCDVQSELLEQIKPWLRSDVDDKMLRLEAEEYYRPDPHRAIAVSIACEVESRRGQSTNNVGIASRLIQIEIIWTHTLAGLRAIKRRDYALESRLDAELTHGLPRLVTMRLMSLIARALDEI